MVHYASIFHHEQPINFLGIAISVKIAKAVKRNHIKRLIRESYRKQEEKPMRRKKLTMKDTVK